MIDYCRWCGVYGETEDLECEKCSGATWQERYHFDPDAEPSKRWRPVVDIRDKGRRI